MNAAVWVLVCDAAKARLFEVRGKKREWQLVETLTHAESRSKARDLLSDHQGRRSSEGGSVHHNALASTPPKEVEKERFAHQLATRLDQALRSQRFDHWVLVAPPHLAGTVRKELTPELAKHLLKVVDSDLSAVGLEELTERLGDAVRVPVDQLDVVRESTKHRH